MPDQESTRTAEPAPGITARTSAEAHDPTDGLDYRVISELATDAIFVYDFETGTILDANRQACELHGFTLEEMRTGGIALISDGTPPFDAEHGRAFVQKAAAGEPQRFEWLSARKSGERFWVEVRLHSVTMRGEPRIVAIVTDIDERKRAEAAVRASEESYRCLFDSLSELVYIQDLDGRFVNVNDAVVRAYGYSRDELIGRTPAMLAAPGKVDVEAAMRQFQRAVDGERQRFEWRGLRRDGSTFLKEVVLSRSTYFGRDVVIAVARDISDRIDAEAALRRSEKRFRRMIENASDLIAIMDGDGTIRYQSPASRRILGYEPEEMVGTNAFEYMQPEDIEATAARLEQLIANPGTRVSAEFRFRHKNGSFRMMESIGATLNADRPEDGVIVNSRDITARTQAERALVMQNALLEAAWESSIDGILVVAPDGGIQSHNSRFVEMWHISDDVVASGSDEAAVQAVLDQLVDPEAFQKRVSYLYDHPDLRSRDTIELRDGRVFDRYTSPVVSSSGEYHGRIWFFRDVTPQKQYERDLETARHEADQHAANLEREMEFGRRVQEGLLPAALPQPVGWEIAAHFCPALQVAGDFYDAFDLPGGHVGLMIADVSGKGVGAALFMALFQSHLRVAIERANTAVNASSADPATNCGVCNDSVLLQAVVETNDYITRLHRNARMFASVFFGVLDPESGVLQYVNAGQDPPVVVRADGQTDRLGTTGPALGLMAGAAFAVGRAVLAPGDMMVAYTDGATEARSPDGGFFGEERMLGMLDDRSATARDVLRTVDRAVKDFAGHAPQSDDLTMLAVRRQG